MPAQVKKEVKKPVKKALSPEEQTALSNIQSILTEILAMGGGEAQAPAEPVEMAEGDPTQTPEEMSTEEKEVKMIIKGLEETPSDSSTASDDAEARMDEVQTPQSEEAVMEVAKALKMLMGGGVKKSAAPVDPMIQILNEIVKVQKAQNESQNEMAQTVGHILRGLGVVDQLQVAKAEAEKKRAPIVDNDNAAVLKAISDALGVNKSEEPKVHKSQGEIARSNLRDVSVLKGLLTK
jgi:hypothetical protein